MATILVLVSSLTFVVGMLTGPVHALMWIFARSRATAIRKRIFIASCCAWGLFLSSFAIYTANPAYKDELNKQNAQRARDEQADAKAKAEAEEHERDIAKAQEETKKARAMTAAAIQHESLPAGEYVIRQEYMATATEADLDTVTEYSIHKDANALAQMALQGRVTILKPGTHVYRVGSGGFLSGKVKIRPKGGTETMWTVREAIAR